MDFDQAFAHADRIQGWLTAAQARVLWDAALAVPAQGAVVEIGSHHGRSTVILASANPVGLTAVDPFEPDWRYGAPGTRQRFEANLAAAGVRQRVRLRVARSTDLRPGWDTPIDVVYIDGKHDYWTVVDDLRWAEHVVPGGTVLLHDAFSSIGVTLALLRTTLTSRRLRYVDRTGSLARFTVAEVTLADRLRPVCEMPWWLRNILVKLLLRLRLGGVARMLRHDGVHDPY